MVYKSADYNSRSILHLEENTGSNFRSKLRELENRTYRYLRMYLTSMNFLVMRPEVSKKLLTCTPAYSNPTPSVFPGDIRMFLIAKFNL